MSHGEERDFQMFENTDRSKIMVFLQSTLKQVVLTAINHGETRVSQHVEN